MTGNRLLPRWPLVRAVAPAALIMTALYSLLSGCALPPAMIKPALETEGEIFAYLEPLPPEADRLRFTIDRIFAVRNDGAEFPLMVALQELNRGTAPRQRLLASGRVPPGRYVGLSSTIKKAVLTGDQGEAALLSAEGRVKADFSFEVQRKHAVVLAASLRYAESVQSGFRFSPVFSLSVPSRPLSGLTGYIANRNDDAVMVFDKKSGRVAAIIATGRGPWAIALDQRAGRAYISLSGEDAVEVLDVTTGSIINRIHLNAGDGPRELTLTPDGKFLLVVNAVSRTLSITDTRSLFELNRIPLGEGPRSVLVDRGGKRAYVFNELSNTITVIDIANRATVVTLSTDTGPMMGQFNRKGDRLYVIFAGSPYLSIINPFTLAIDRKVFAGPGLSFIKVDSVTDMLYACRKQDAVVEVYDPFSLSAGVYIQALSGVSYMTIDGDENALYLASPETGRVVTVNLISKKITTMTDAGEDPVWVTMMGER